MTSCRLCKRERASSSSFCKYHLTAKANLESAYKQWNEAYAGLTWQEFLVRVMRSPETGQWAKEVAEMLAKEPGTKASST